MQQHLMINIMAVLDGITSEDVYVKFIKVVSKMAGKCKINDIHFLSVCKYWPVLFRLPL